MISIDISYDKSQKRVKEADHELQLIQIMNIFQFNSFFNMIVNIFVSWYHENIEFY